MPNHYTNVLYVFPGYREEDERPHSLVEELVYRSWGDRPLDRVMPMPAELVGTRGMTEVRDPDLISRFGFDNWYDWQVGVRGCKWDAYDMQLPVRLPGDSQAVQITFCTAWSPPNARVQALIARELIDEYGAGRVVWVGLEPYDCSFVVVGQWEWVPGPRLVEVTP